MKDQPLYNNKSKNLAHVEGAWLYSLIDISVRLTESNRQKDDLAFAALLQRVAAGTYTAEDHQLLLTRDMDTLSPKEKASFTSSAVKLCTTRAATKSFNLHNLIKIGQPVVKLKSINSCKAAEKADTNTAKNLAKHVVFCNGSLVVLTTNLWTDAKLVNGSTGIVRKIVFRDGQSPANGDHPAFVLVEFGDFIGPAFLSNHPTWVPIKAITKNWWDKNKQLSRTQYPLMLGYSLTIHKSQVVQKVQCSMYNVQLQGMTLSKVIIDIGEREYAAGINNSNCKRLRNYYVLGLTYTALSRAKHLVDLALDPMPLFHR